MLDLGPCQDCQDPPIVPAIRNLWSPSSRYLGPKGGWRVGGKEGMRQSSIKDVKRETDDRYYIWKNELGDVGGAIPYRISSSSTDGTLGQEYEDVNDGW